VAGGLDRRERPFSVAGLALDQVLGDAGLNVDRRQGVCDDVVQLARDPQSLLPGAPLRFLFACLLGELEPVGQQPNVPAMVAEGLARKDGDCDEGGVSHRLQRERVRVSADEKEFGDDDRHGCRERGDDDVAAAAHQRERVERGGGSDDRGRAGGVIDREQRQDEPAGGGECDSRARRRKTRTAAAATARAIAGGRFDASARRAAPTTAIAPTSSSTVASISLERSRCMNRI
jgi:hypothetical protein